MTRETVTAKADRYLAEARLTILRVDGERVAAICHGGTRLYQLGHEPGQGWWCTCPARGDRCCHLEALRLVTVRRLE